METKGGYDGKLLHGYYKSFYLNNQLKESGEIKYGTKHKEWRYWYSDGTLKEIINWKEGRKDGVYKIFNDQGKLIAKGYFKNDLIHGKFYTYDNSEKITATKKYRYGKEILPKVKRTKKQKEKHETEKPKTSEPDLEKNKKINLNHRLKKLFHRGKKKNTSQSSERKTRETKKGSK
jgi:hypothetical protein